MQYLEFMFLGFWHFVGCMLILGLCSQIVSLPFKLINRYIRHRNILKHGWPPAHLDGDADFKEEKL